MSYSIIVTEPLPKPHDKSSLRPKVKNLIDHMMDFYMQIFRLHRIKDGYNQLVLENPDDYITNGPSSVDY